MEIIYEPCKSIVIHEIIQSSIDNLVQLQAFGVPPKQFGRPINWTDGVAFIYALMPSTEEVVKEQMKGRVHWSHLAFAFMPTHRPQMTTADGKIKIPIINVSHNRVFKDLAKWIRENYKEVL